MMYLTTKKIMGLHKRQLEFRTIHLSNSERISELRECLKEAGFDVIKKIKLQKIKEEE